MSHRLRKGTRDDRYNHGPWRGKKHEGGRDERNLKGDEFSHPLNLIWENARMSSWRAEENDGLMLRWGGKAKRGGNDDGTGFQQRSRGFARCSRVCLCPYIQRPVKLPMDCERGAGRLLFDGNASVPCGPVAVLCRAGCSIALDISASWTVFGCDRGGPSLLRRRAHSGVGVDFRCDGNLIALCGVGGLVSRRGLVVGALSGVD